MLTLYTIASLVLAFVTLVGGSQWMRTREHRKLTKALKSGREHEALILDSRSIKPTIFNTENIRLKVQILTDNPIVVEFGYDASYPEWRDLTTGKVVTVAMDPADPQNVLVVRRSSQPAKTSSPRNSPLLVF